MSLTLKDSLGLIETVESRLSSYWNFYIVVSVAAIGWLMSASVPFLSCQGLVLAVVLLCLMAGHLAVVVSTTNRICALQSEALACAEAENLRSDHLKTQLRASGSRARMTGSIGLHLVLDAGLLFAVIHKAILRAGSC